MVYHGRFPPHPFIHLCVPNSTASPAQAPARQPRGTPRSTSHGEACPAAIQAGIRSRSPPICAPPARLQAHVVSIPLRPLLSILHLSSRPRRSSDVAGSTRRQQIARLRASRRRRSGRREGAFQAAASWTDRSRRPRRRSGRLPGGEQRHLEVQNATLPPPRQRNQCCITMKRILARRRRSWSGRGRTIRTAYRGLSPRRPWPIFLWRKCPRATWRAQNPQPPIHTGKRRIAEQGHLALLNRCIADTRRYDVVPPSAAPPQ